MAHTDLVAAAQDLLGPDEEVEAAGIFGLQDDYRAIETGGVATAIAMPDHAAPGAAGLAAGANIALSREKNAEAQGVTVRMLVALTPSSIHVMSMHAVGGGPQKLLMSFDRASTEVEISRFGLSRKLKLTDPKSGQHLGLTGNTARFTYGAKGDKAVLDALSAS